MKENLVKFIKIIRENNDKIEKLTNEIQCLLQSCTDQECKEKIKEFNILIMASSMMINTTLLGVDTCVKNMRDKPGKKVW